MNKIETAEVFDQLRSTTRSLDHRIASLIQNAEEEAVPALASIAQQVSHLSYLLTLPISAMPRNDARYDQRSILQLAVDGAEYECGVLDISCGGALIDCDVDLSVGAHVTLVHPEVGNLPAHVAGISSEGLHVSFDELESSQSTALARIITDAYLA